MAQEERDAELGGLMAEANAISVTVQVAACVALGLVGVGVLLFMRNPFGWVFLTCGVGGCVSLGAQVWAETKGKR